MLNTTPYCSISKHELKLLPLPQPPSSGAPAYGEQNRTYGVPRARCSLFCNQQALSAWHHMTHRVASHCRFPVIALLVYSQCIDPPLSWRRLIRALRGLPADASTARSCLHEHAR